MAGENRKILSPFFAPLFIVGAMTLYYIICFIFKFKFGYFDIEEIGVSEVLTYLFYGVGLGVSVCLASDFIHSDKKYTYYAIMFLWLSALFREMGIQHWLTTHDSVITKTRFFTNPNNPWYEKAVAGVLMLLVLSVAIYLVIKYFKKIVTGFFKLKALNWTIVSFGVLVILTQIADRFPANHFKSTGVELSDPVLFILKIFEEGGESLLPLLFAFGMAQYHFSIEKEEK